jgi:hypothetical protein
MSLREISASIDERRVRNVLYTIGVILSAVLAPSALVGAFIGVESVFTGALNPDDLETGSIGVMAFSGIVGAWMRLVMPSERFRSSQRLRWIVSISIGLGILAAMAMIGIDDWDGVTAVLLGTVALIGLYLLCATLGAARE